MEVLLGASLGVGTLWKDRITVGMLPGGAIVASMVNYTGVRDRVYT